MKDTYAERRVFANFFPIFVDKPFRSSDFLFKCSIFTFFDVTFQGCNEVLRRQISRYSIAVGGLAGGVIAVQLLAISFATCVASNVKKHRRISDFY